jgi:hypothetical protein
MVLVAQAEIGAKAQQIAAAVAVADQEIMAAEAVLA